MYYAPDQPSTLFIDKAQATDDVAGNDRAGRRIRVQKQRLVTAVVVAVLLGGGLVWSYGWVQTAVSPKAPASPVKAAANVAPTQKPEVAGASFGDLLKKSRDYAGWLAGIEEGNVVVANPASGERNQLTDVSSVWFGPVSTLYWSPDHSKLAYLVLPEDEAVGFSNNPQGQAAALGLNGVSSPQTFPYGHVVVLDVASKQLTRTGMTIRNTPKSLVWLDGDRLAMIASTLSIYSLKDDTTTPVSGVGVTSADTQLQSPLAWSAVNETIYFTTIKNLGEQSVRLISSVALSTSAVQEHGVIKSGSFDQVASSQGVDLALSEDGSRLGVAGQEGLGYLTLSDGGVHQLPYNSDWLWIKESLLSDLQWLSPSRLAFESMATDGSKVWAVWDIPANSMNTFGKGALNGSWDKTTGRLATVQSDGKQIGILSPNWDNPAESDLELLELGWQVLGW